MNIAFYWLFRIVNDFLESLDSIQLKYGLLDVVFRYIIKLLDDNTCLLNVVLYFAAFLDLKFCYFDEFF